MPSKKNRDYTRLVRTPSSMAWLIKQRARLQGKIDILQKKFDSIPSEIAELQEVLRSLDRTFPLHEVQVEPSEIEGRRPKRAALAPHGALTKHILTQLREASGPLYTAEIGLSFARAFSIDLSKVSQAELADAVLKRLQVLVKRGVVQRHHEKETTRQGSWSLVLDEVEDPA